MDAMSQAAAPDPFSRQGAGEAQGLGSTGEPDKFATGADGSTPLTAHGPAFSGQPESASSAGQAPSPYQNAYDQAAGYGTGQAAGYGTPEADPYAARTAPAGYSAQNPQSSDPYAATDRSRGGTRGYGAHDYAPESTYEPTDSELRAEPSNFPTYPYGGQGQPTPARYPGQGMAQAGFYQSPYGAPVRSSGNAVASLVLGIAGFMVWVTGPLAIGFGVAGLRQVRREPNRYGGSGMAIAGIVLGSLSTMLMAFFVLMVMAAGFS